MQINSPQKLATQMKAHRPDSAAGDPNMKVLYNFAVSIGTFCKQTLGAISIREPVSNVSASWRWPISEIQR